MLRAFWVAPSPRWLGWRHQPNRRWAPPCPAAGGGRSPPRPASAGSTAPRGTPAAPPPCCCPARTRGHVGAAAGPWGGGAAPPPACRDATCADAGASVQSAVARPAPHARPAARPRTPLFDSAQPLRHSVRSGAPTHPQQWAPSARGSGAAAEKRGRRAMASSWITLPFVRSPGEKEDGFPSRETPPPPGQQQARAGARRPAPAAAQPAAPRRRRAGHGDRWGRGRREGGAARRAGAPLGARWAGARRRRGEIASPLLPAPPPPPTTPPLPRSAPSFAPSFCPPRAAAGVAGVNHPAGQRGLGQGGVRAALRPAGARSQGGRPRQRQCWQLGRAAAAAAAARCGCCGGRLPVITAAAGAAPAHALSTSPRAARPPTSPQGMAPVIRSRPCILVTSILVTLVFAAASALGVVLAAAAEQRSRRLAAQGAAAGRARRGSARGGGAAGGKAGTAPPAAAAEQQPRRPATRVRRLPHPSHTHPTPITAPRPPRLRPGRRGGLPDQPAQLHGPRVCPLRLCPRQPLDPVYCPALPDGGHGAAGHRQGAWRGWVGWGVGWVGRQGARAARARPWRWAPADRRSLPPSRQGSDGIRLRLAPGGVVRFAVPANKSAGVLGLDLLKGGGERAGRVEGWAGGVG
jgi:hypothetical protein